MYPGIVQQENLANTEEQLRRVLFGKGQEGVWFDPSDLSTMFQDVDGTIPVTTDGDPVGRILDKSGNGNHATASSAANFTYRTDGTHHWIECFTVGTLTFTGAGYQNISNVCQFSALKRLGNSYTTTMSSSPEQAGRWLMVNNPTGAGNTTLNNASFFQQGVNRLNGTTFIDDRAVLANALQNPAVIGVTEINCINSNGIAINISGRYDLSSFDGSNFYGFIEWQGNSSLAVVQKVEQYLANKAGITLP